MHYYEILPIAKTGAEDTAFTYQSEDPLTIGSLVLIPLRNRRLRGLVIGKVSKPAFNTRGIIKIQSEEPVLTEIQLQIARKMATYYLCALGEVIRTMLSFDFGKKRREPKEKEKKSKKKLETPPRLTAEQQKTFDAIESGQAAAKFLIFGVTGSGKTEIYLRLAAEALKEGKSTVILVPEISLTPQISERFIARFGDVVAIWHSDLLETEKYRTWQKIKEGKIKIVLGARSALFTPFSDLGYLIIDEEHETSYKQDQNPRYEAGRVAEWISDLTGAKLVLGSATPKIETYNRAEKGEYRLLSLKNRIFADAMPPVKIVDLRDEFRKGNKSIFSDDLFEAVNEALKQKKQVLLFVNRRGASTFVVCRDCGQVLACPNCEIPLTYHPSEGEILTCHHCDFQTPVPAVCPNCHSHAIKYFGLGTQRAEIEARKMFPKAKIARMDRDTTKKRGSHGEIYQSFANRDHDILIGTQLIAKGWDLPNVAVVGIISADTMLNFPDFRSSERTFDLLTQVAGRTGRGYHPGQVIIQTYSPENYAITAAAGHDFPEFYRREIKEREKYSYPPFARLIKLTFSDPSEKKAEERATALYEKIAKITNDKGEIKVMGPNPAFLPKLSGKYRYQIVIKSSGPDSEAVKAKVKKALAEDNPKGWTLDIDPDNLL